MTRFLNKREVIFVFDRKLKQADIWDKRKQSQMADAAVNFGAVSNF
jgi:hypothetical protein